MLDKETIKKIEDFVFEQPRSIQEITIHLDKNWRTVNRYVGQIIEERATLETKIFREGTRGALKVVYWASVEKRKNNIFQEQLKKEIMNTKNKKQFSAFDIYQHVEDKNKSVILENISGEDLSDLKELVSYFKQTKKELVSLSGNLSYLNLKVGKIKLFDKIEELVKRGIRIKVLCRVDLAGKKNIEKLLSLNHKYKKELIEVKHCKQPIRAFIFDKKILRLKEVSEPTEKIHELDKKTYIFYTIKDPKWAEWMNNLFLQMFHHSVGAETRLDELNKIVR